MRHFRSEYEAHVFHKTCPAGQCAALRKITINPDKCKGCTACVRRCPVNAITGEKKKPHKINEAACIKCGVCAEACKFAAVEGA
jgi:Na+-translocating ferredoxin:NAD+ oxidoreductase RNF subunit RnfB